MSNHSGRAGDRHAFQTLPHRFRASSSGGRCPLGGSWPANALDCSSWVGGEMELYTSDPRGCADHPGTCNPGLSRPDEGGGGRRARSAGHPGQPRLSRSHPYRCRDGRRRRPGAPAATVPAGRRRGVPGQVRRPTLRVRRPLFGARTDRGSWSSSSGGTPTPRSQAASRPTSSRVPGCPGSRSWSWPTGSSPRPAWTEREAPPRRPAAPPRSSSASAAPVGILRENRRPKPRVGSGDVDRLLGGRRVAIANYAPRAWPPVKVIISGADASGQERARRGDHDDR